MHIHTAFANRYQKDTDVYKDTAKPTAAAASVPLSHKNARAHRYKAYVFIFKIIKDTDKIKLLE